MALSRSSSESSSDSLDIKGSSLRGTLRRILFSLDLEDHVIKDLVNECQKESITLQQIAFTLDKSTIAEKLFLLDSEAQILKNSCIEDLKGRNNNNKNTQKVLEQNSHQDGFHAQKDIMQELQIEDQLYEQKSQTKPSFVNTGIQLETKTLENDKQQVHTRSDTFQGVQNSQNSQTLAPIKQEYSQKREIILSEQDEQGQVLNIAQTRSGLVDINIDTKTSTTLQDLYVSEQKINTQLPQENNKPLVLGSNKQGSLQDGLENSTSSQQLHYNDNQYSIQELDTRLQQGKKNETSHQLSQFNGAEKDLIELNTSTITVPIAKNSLDGNRNNFASEQIRDIKNTKLYEISENGGDQKNCEMIKDKISKSSEKLIEGIRNKKTTESLESVRIRSTGQLKENIRNRIINNINEGRLSRNMSDVKESGKSNIASVQSETCKDRPAGDQAITQQVPNTNTFKRNIIQENKDRLRNSSIINEMRKKVSTNSLECVNYTNRLASSFTNRKQSSVQDSIESNLNSKSNKNQSAPKNKQCNMNMKKDRKSQEEGAGKYAEASPSRKADGLNPYQSVSPRSLNDSQKLSKVIEERPAIETFEKEQREKELQDVIKDTLSSNFNIKTTMTDDTTLDPQQTEEITQTGVTSQSPKQKPIFSKENLQLKKSQVGSQGLGIDGIGTQKKGKDLSLRLNSYVPEVQGDKVILKTPTKNQYGWKINQKLQELSNRDFKLTQVENSPKGIAIYYFQQKHDNINNKQELKEKQFWDSNTIQSESTYKNKYLNQAKNIQTQGLSPTRAFNPSSTKSINKVLQGPGIDNKSRLYKKNLTEKVNESNDFLRMPSQIPSFMRPTKKSEAYANITNQERKCVSRSKVASTSTQRPKNTTLTRAKNNFQASNSQRGPQTEDTKNQKAAGSGYFQQYQARQQLKDTRLTVPQPFVLQSQQRGAYRAYEDFKKKTMAKAVVSREAPSKLYKELSQQNKNVGLSTPKPVKDIRRRRELDNPRPREMNAYIDYMAQYTSQQTEYGFIAKQDIVDPVAQNEYIDYLEDHNRQVTQQEM